MYWLGRIPAASWTLLGSLLGRLGGILELLGRLGGRFWHPSPAKWGVWGPAERAERADRARREGAGVERPASWKPFFGRMNLEGGTGNPSSTPCSRGKPRGRRIEDAWRRITGRSPNLRYDFLDVKSVPAAPGGLRRFFWNLGAKNCASRASCGALGSSWGHLGSILEASWPKMAKKIKLSSLKMGFMLKNDTPLDDFGPFT